MGRDQNKFTVTLVGDCPQTLTPIYFPLKWEPVPHRQYEDWINISVGNLMHGILANSWLLSPSLLYSFTYFSLVEWFKSNRSLHWSQNLKIEPICSWLDFLSTPCGQPYSDIPMHHYRFARSKPFVMMFVAVHSGCCQILYIWNHRLLGDPFWKIFCWCLG